MGVFANNLLIGAASSAGGGGATFDTTLIPNSAAFDGSNDFLSNAFGADTDRKKAVVGCWLQRLFGSTGDRTIFALTGGSPQSSWRFETGEQLHFFDHTSGAFQCDVDANPIVFRDYGWYHFMASWDTTESSASDRFKMFLNGTELTLNNKMDGRLLHCRYSKTCRISHPSFYARQSIHSGWRRSCF